MAAISRLERRRHETSYGPDGFQQAKGYPIMVRSSAASYDSDIQRQLWEISEKLTGVAFPV